MRCSNSMMIVLLAVMTAAMAAGCGGGSDSSKEATSSAVTTLPVEGAPFGDRMAAAGYRVVQFRDFPAQQQGRQAYAVVYRAGSSGGVLCTATQGNSGDQPVWHWYFSDGAPDSVAYLELNDDGLWDVRIYFGEEHRDFIQESDFSLFGKLRSDLIAVNGTASQQDGLWQAFDGDTTTAWTAGGDKGWLEVRSPLGLRDGVLALQLFGYSAQGSETPFWRYAALGGRAHSRGYRSGRYLGRTLLAFQGEYRMPPLWRFAPNVFAGLSDVAEGFDQIELSRMRPTVGAGIRTRLDASGKKWARVEAAYGQELRLYAGLGVAF